MQFAHIRHALAKGGFFLNGGTAPLNWAVWRETADRLRSARVALHLPVGLGRALCSAFFLRSALCNCPSPPLDPAQLRL